MEEFTETDYHHLLGVGLFVAWMGASAVAVWSKNGGAFANSGIFLVLLLLVSFGGVKAELDSVLKKAEWVQLKLQDVSVSDAKLTSRLNVRVLHLTMVQENIATNELLISPKNIKELVSPEMTSFFERIELRTKRLREEEGRLLKAVAAIQTEMDAMRLLIIQTEYELERVKEDTQELFGSFSTLETLLAVIGSLQMTFGMFLIRKIKVEAPSC